MLEVKVTQEHINRGIRANTNQCPIALALRDIFQIKSPKYRDISVDSYTIKVYRVYFSITKRAKTFMNKFDQNQEVKPITFRFTEL